jgi:hypothetical protein
MRSSKTRAVAALLILLALFACAPVSGAHALQHSKKEVRFEPVVKQRAEDYAGRYVGITPGYYLEIKAGGKLSITSHERNRRATLRDVRLAGARLTATRVYPNGATKEFDATFVNRIMNGESSFGILVENLGAEHEEITFDRVFFRLDRAR